MKEHVYYVKTKLLLLVVLLGPTTTYAGSLQQTSYNIRTQLGLFVAVGIGLALALFIAGMVTFLAKGPTNEQAHEKGRQRMVWGVIALFFMVSVWGIISILQVFFGTSTRQYCGSTNIDISRNQIVECFD